MRGMGAWGTGSFENDAAMDWAAGVKSLDDLRALFDRLKRETDATKGKPVSEKYGADADYACELLAAAETIAMLMGRRSRDFPDDLAERLADAGEPESLLYHQARNAVVHVMRKSELAELWAEETGEGEPNEWLVELTHLIERLNPDIEVEPWTPEEVVEKVGAPAGPCGFCGKMVTHDDAFMMTLYDSTNRRSINHGFWFHLPCLNARLHHKHALPNLKFDPLNMPDLKKL